MHLEIKPSFLRCLFKGYSTVFFVDWVPAFGLCSTLWERKRGNFFELQLVNVLSIVSGSDCFSLFERLFSNNGGREREKRKELPYLRSQCSQSHLTLLHSSSMSSRCLCNNFLNSCLQTCS